jgi:chromosome segregation ATPase
MSELKNLIASLDTFYSGDQPGRNDDIADLEGENEHLEGREDAGLYQRIAELEQQVQEERASREAMRIELVEAVNERDELRDGCVALKQQLDATKSECDLRSRNTPIILRC